MEDGFYVGIHGSTRHSTLAVATAGGQIIAVHNTGPLAYRVNHDLRPNLENAIRDLVLKVDPALRSLLEKRTKGLCIAMSGVFQPLDQYAVKRMVEGQFRQSSIVICEDVWTDLPSHGFDEGIVISVGTGTNFFAKNSKAQYLNVGGWGSELDDCGSGFYIGRLVLGKLLKHCDGREIISSPLRDAVLEELQLRSLDQIVPWYFSVRESDYWRAKISDLCTIVDRLAQTGEEDAVGIMEEGIAEFYVTLKAGFANCKKREILDLSDPTIILSGGALLNSKMYQQAVTKKIIAISKEFGNGTVWKTQLGIHKRIIGTLAFAISGKCSTTAHETIRNLVTSLEETKHAY